MKLSNILRLIIITILVILMLNMNVIANTIGHTEDNVVSVYDDEGDYIFGTAMGVTIGDKYISEENIEYVVVSVNEHRAVAESNGEIDLFASLGYESNVLTPIAAQGSKVIGIYHTHNGESYLPGSDNVSGKGEIHEVGNVLKNALEEKGIKVLKLENLHLPHDGAAYERSRDTATDISKQRPDAIFDVHRDAIPRKEEYLTEIDGKTISQVRLVVGRQNPNQKVNDQFAKSLKAIADQDYPGLIKGIFYGGGSYNQQLSAHSLLLEFGTHVTTKEQAAASAQILAASTNKLLYGSGSVQARGGASENRSIISTIGWIIGIVVLGMLAFLFINEGSIDGVIKRIKNFFGREILDRGDK